MARRTLGRRTAVRLWGKRTQAASAAKLDLSDRFRRLRKMSRWVDTDLISEVEGDGGDGRVRYCLVCVCVCVVDSYDMLCTQVAAYNGQDEDEI